MSQAGVCSGTAFANFLAQQTPKFDKLLIQTIRPQDGWIGHVSTGTQEAGVGNTLYQDRLEVTYPNVSRPWQTVDTTSCVGTPCDPEENCIGYGTSRINYSPMRQSWSSQLFCYDQLIPITRVKEQVMHIISKILRPATNRIVSNLLRRQALFWAQTKLVADANLTPFIYRWVTNAAGDEVFLDTSAMPTSLLLPQMLERQVQPLTALGYHGERPYEGQDMLPLIELVTDMDTTWLLQHLGGSQGVGGTPGVAPNWRFEQWGAASKYWRYGLSGQMGDFAIRVDPEQMRFQFVGNSGDGTYPFRFQLVPPFINVPSSGAGGSAGIKSIPNPDYFTARYRMTFIWHKRAMEILTQESPSINGEMPFMKRDFAGKWFFAMDNLTCGVDVNGNPIAVDNARRNKGMFKADFYFWIRPLYPEFAVAFFHQSNPQCFSPISACGTEGVHTVQTYESCNDLCE